MFDKGNVRESVANVICRRRTRLRCAPLTFGILVTGCLVGHLQAAEGYKVVDLGVCTATNDGAESVTDNGLVGVQLNTYAYVWNNGSLTPAGGVPDGNTQMRINSLGDIAGANNLNAYLWAQRCDDAVRQPRRGLHISLQESTTSMRSSALPTEVASIAIAASSGKTGL